MLTARSWAVEGSLAYAPITAWLRSAPLRPLLDSLDDVWLSEISRLLPELLADHPGLAAPAPMLERWQRQRLFEAVARAVASARTRPLLILDDANWADSDTLEWLHFMLRTAAVTGFVILGVRSGEVESNPIPGRARVRRTRSRRAPRHRARTVVRGRNRDALAARPRIGRSMPRHTHACITRPKVIRCSWWRWHGPGSSALPIPTPRELRRAGGCRHRLA